MTWLAAFSDFNTLFVVLDPKAFGEPQAVLDRVDAGLAASACMEVSNRFVTVITSLPPHAPAQNPAIGTITSV